MVNRKLLELPSYWSRYSWYSDTKFPPKEDDFTLENMKHLYLMTYHLRLNDGGRWLWRMYAATRGFALNPYEMEKHDLAKSYRRSLKRRIRPTRIGPLSVITNQV